MPSSVLKFPEKTAVDLSQAQSVDALKQLLVEAERTNQENAELRQQAQELDEQCDYYLEQITEYTLMIAECETHFAQIRHTRYAMEQALLRARDIDIKPLKAAIAAFSQD